ncbi:MAG: hypothetical protein ACRYFX_02495 [Janthinobacterium lividum]
METFYHLRWAALAGLLLATGWLLPRQARAQNNACGMHWESQRQALSTGYGNNDGGVFYGVQLSPCDKTGGVCGWPKISLQHTYPYPATVSVTLEGVACDGKRSSASFSTGGNTIPANQNYVGQGNWHSFRQVDRVLRVEVAYQKGKDHYRVEYDESTGRTEVYINNRNAAQREADKAAADKKAADKAAADKKSGGGGLGISLGGGGGGGGGRSGGSGGSSSAKNGNSTSNSASNSASSARSGSSSNKNSSASGKSSSSSSASKGSTTTSYPVESEHDRQMRERGNAERARTDQANAEAIAGGTVVAAGMAGLAMHELDNNDEDDDLSSYLKLTLGLGLQEIPVTENATYNAASSQRTYKSNSSTTNHLDVRVGLLFAVLNDHFVSLRLSPFASYGLNAFTASTTGSHLSYGSGGAIGLGHRLKLLVQGEYAARSGTLLSDYATLGIDAASTSDYKYSTLKYGLGAYYGLGGANAFVQASAFRENVSFLKGVKANVLSYEAKFSFAIMAIAVQYSPNYPIAGTLTYPNGYQRDQQDYVSANLYVPLTLFSN